MSSLKDKIKTVQGQGYAFSKVRFEDFATCCEALNDNAEVLKKVVTRLERLEQLEEKLEKIEQIVEDYDGSAVSMVKQFSEIQEILEQERGL